MFSLTTLLTLSVLCAQVLGTPLDLSNAERLQQGLPLKAPNRHYDPSRTNHLRARASIAPLPPAQQQPGSTVLQVIQGAGATSGSKRQTNAGSAIGFLGYNPATGTFQVGSTGSAASFYPPIQSPQTNSVYLSSPDLAGQRICARIVAVGDAGQSQINGFVLEGDTQSGLAGNLNCFPFAVDTANNRLVATDFGSRPFLLSIDPATNNIIGTSAPFQGTQTGYIPAPADRIYFSLGFQAVQQPAAQPGASYPAVLRISTSASSLNYVQFREFDTFSGFYQSGRADATVFTVTRGTSDPSRLTLSFTFAGTPRLVGLRSNTECTADQAECQPGPDIFATPSIYDQFITADRPLLTEGIFTYPSTNPRATGLLGHYTVQGRSGGQPVTQNPDISFRAFNALQAQIVSPTGSGSYSDVSIDIIPI